MNCPNCGLANPDTAKFCANCGTSFGNASSRPYQPAQPYSAPNVAPGGRSMTRNIALGCLIILAIFLFFGLSCTRACFSWRHGRTYLHRRYY